MIIFYLLKLLISIGTVLTGFFGRVDILPFGIDSILVTMVGYFKAAIITLPYLEIVFTYFLWVIGFEIALKVLKVILGSRSPAHDIK